MLKGRASDGWGMYVVGWSCAPLGFTEPYWSGDSGYYYSSSMAVDRWASMTAQPRLAIISTRVSRRHFQLPRYAFSITFQISSLIPKEPPDPLRRETLAVVVSPFSL